MSARKMMETYKGRYRSRAGAWVRARDRLLCAGAVLLIVGTTGQVLGADSLTAVWTTMTDRIDYFLYKGFFWSKDLDGDGDIEGLNLNVNRDLRNWDFWFGASVTDWTDGRHAPGPNDFTVWLDGEHFRYHGGEENPNTLAKIWTKAVDFGFAPGWPGSTHLWAYNSEEHPRTGKREKHFDHYMIEVDVVAVPDWGGRRHEVKGDIAVEAKHGATAKYSFDKHLALGSSPASGTVVSYDAESRAMSFSIGGIDILDADGGRTGGIDPRYADDAVLRAQIEVSDLELVGLEADGRVRFGGGALTLFDPLEQFTFDGHSSRYLINDTSERDPLSSFSMFEHLDGVDIGDQDERSTFLVDFVRTNLFGEGISRYEWRRIAGIDFTFITDENLAALTEGFTSSVSNVPATFLVCANAVDWDYFCVPFIEVGRADGLIVQNGLINYEQGRSDGDLTITGLRGSVETPGATPPVRVVARNLSLDFEETIVTREPAPPELVLELVRSPAMLRLHETVLGLIGAEVDETTAYQVTLEDARHGVQEDIIEVRVIVPADPGFVEETGGLYQGALVGTAYYRPLTGDLRFLRIAGKNAFEYYEPNGLLAVNTIIPDEELEQAVMGDFDGSPAALMGDDGAIIEVDCKTAESFDDKYRVATCDYYLSVASWHIEQGEQEFRQNGNSDRFREHMNEGAEFLKRAADWNSMILKWIVKRLDCRYGSCGPVEVADDGSFWLVVPEGSGWDLETHGIVLDFIDSASPTAARLNIDPTAPDCNGNGIPDACDIGDHFSEDCNGNGIPDECDIANGTSEDANDDGVPDECERDWHEDFDAYQEGPLADQSDWEPWNGDPVVADFVVTGEEFRSSPHSLAIDDVDDAVRRFSGYTSGAWTLSAWVYVRPEMDDVQWFILLNQYPTVYPTGWSLALELNGRDGILRDLGTDATLPLVRGRWAEIRVEIDLDEDSQSVYYDGDLLTTKSWSDGLGSGVVYIAALDLWGAGSDHTVYYDDLSLEEVTEADCLGDVNGDGVVDFADLLAVLAAWGPYERCPPFIREDIDQNCEVGFSDLLEVLANWGSCI